MKTLTYFVLVILITVGAVFGCAQTLRAQAQYKAVTKYDPKRDAAQDIREAAAEAKRTNRRVLLEVGGEWCSWCHHMDDFFAAHPDLTSQRDKSFVTVKINFSEENPNKEVLGQYPAVAGYPHLFVLDSDGTLVHSQDTSALEEGKSYNLERFNTFLAYWTWAKEK
jgi:thiol:disulfide interchange protein